MKTAEFNQDYELDRKTRSGIRANPKHAPAVMTRSPTVKHFSSRKSNACKSELQNLNSKRRECSNGIQL